MRINYQNYMKEMLDPNFKYPTLYELSCNDKVIMVTTMPKIRAYLDNLKKNCKKQQTLFGESK